MKTKTPIDLPEGYLDFFKALESWQNQQQVKLKQTYTPQEIDIKKILVNTNRSIMQSVDFELESLNFREVFAGLLKFLVEVRPEIKAQLAKIESVADQLDFAQLPIKLLEGDGEYFASLAQKLDLPEDLFVFCIDHALRPFLRLWAAPYQKSFTEAGFEVWDFATVCPFCASKSYFSRFRSADGRRFMFCDQCFSEWETRAVFCVHCSNSDPQTIRYLSIEGFPAYQALVCEECKGYSKAFDERKKAIRIDPYITNVETVYLDIMAQEQGFTSHDED